MSHKLEMFHIGPIEQCSFCIDNFTVLTGPQANGKSTIAKAVYFFKTIKQDILNIMLQGGPASVSGNTNATWEHTLKQRMKDKFMQLFGSSWAMQHDMHMTYTYAPGVDIHIYLDINTDTPSRNYISIDFSNKIEDYFFDLQVCIFTNMNADQKKYQETRLNKLFADQFETVFIPAGRNLITLLSTQLNYIFTSLDEPQLRNIDYITRRYTELILKLKPMFSAGMNGILSDAANEPTREKLYKKNRPAIHLLMEKAYEVMGGEYRFVDGEERLYLSSGKYVKINLASSGQQEVIWIFNLLFYYLLEDKRIFLIVEEPESHLYPSSQQIMAEVLALMYTSKNSVLVTTHSPYILGTFNYLLLAGQIPLEHQTDISKRIHKRFWISPNSSKAYYIEKGTIHPALCSDDNITLIQNELIDGASTVINEQSDFLLTYLYKQEGE